MRWFGHVMKRNDMKTVRVAMEINIKRKTSSGKPMKGLTVRIENDRHRWCE